MSKIKLTKNELKKQKDGLKRFSRYLPMLVLKKQQLQAEILKVHRALEEASFSCEELRRSIVPWADVFAENNLDIQAVAAVGTIRTTSGNIAGIDIPIFEGVDFNIKPIEYMTTPVWVDAGIAAYKQALELKARLSVLHKQSDILKEELRVTTQRVNLFEKIKIPQAREHIRVINIFMGDMQTAAVGRGKIAKAKLETYAQVSA